MPATPPTAAALRSFGLDPGWSRVVEFTLETGERRSWHVLDTGEGPARTLVCVHGNPTWSYLWRGLLETLPPGWRVVAVDQSSMGFSERETPPRLETRVAELVAFCRSEVDGPLALAGHDWGGAIATGASAHLPVTALILTNTAVARPDRVPVPPLIRVARAALGPVCSATPLFVAGTAAMGDRTHRRALRAPYQSRARRLGVERFVEDIPLVPADPSFAALAAVTAAAESTTAPTLLVYGGDDPVFHDRFLADVRRRIPHAAVERLAGCGHLAPLDPRFTPLVARWLDTLHEPHPPHGSPRHGRASVYEAIARRRDDDGAVLRTATTTLTWRELAARRGVAAGALRAADVGVGTRVSLLVPPGPDLCVAVAALFAVGAVPVVADLTGGLAQLRALHRAAAPDAVVGTATSLALATLLGIAPGAIRCSVRGPIGVRLDRGPTLADEAFAPLGADDLAAIVHTSGATGPAKPVRYTHGALAAQAAMLRASFPVDADAAITSSFAPFLLLAPAMETTFVLPSVDVGRPGDLRVHHLDAARHGQRIALAWLAPTAAAGLSRGGGHLPIARTLLAGAPITNELRHSVAACTGGDVDAPYGMTECLPITDGRGSGTGPLGGGSTGAVLPGCTVVVAPLEDPTSTVEPGDWGELLVHAPWMYDGYDQRLSVNLETTVFRDGVRFHRTGDVGYLHEGVLFHLGRLAHVVHHATGPLASVAIEEPIAAATGLSVAAVGVGPRGTEQVVVVISSDATLKLAPSAPAAAVRAAATVPVAAVLTGKLPLDRRHRSKVDRIALAHAATVLLGG